MRVANKRIEKDAKKDGGLAGQFLARLSCAAYIKLGELLNATFV